MFKYIGSIALCFIMATALLMGCIEDTFSSKTTLKIFHAGSLTKVFSQLEIEFEDRYDHVDVQREAAGSAETIRKVTDLGKKADIVGSADYLLIKDMMLDTYAEWCIMFAHNKMVLAYTERSAYANMINDSNWHEILKKSDVKFGFSNPNFDPCGYRSIMAIKLAEIHLGIPSLFNNLVEKHTAITQWEDRGLYYIGIPEDVNPDSKIIIRPKETDLIALLQNGDIDYLFIYYNIAYSYKVSGVKFIILPDCMNLGNYTMETNYSKIRAILNMDTKNRIEVTATPIVYGITIPKNSENKAMAIEFIKLLLSDTGRHIMMKNGLEPLDKYGCINPEKIDPELEGYL